MKRKQIIIFLLLLTSITVAWAGLTEDLLNRAHSVRSMAMGNTGVAIVKGAQAVFFNPAGILSDNYDMDFYSHYQSTISEINTMAFSFSKRQLNLFNQTLPLGAALILEDAGSQDEYLVDAFDDPLYVDTFSENRLLLAATTGFNFTDLSLGSFSISNLKLGFTGKYYTHDFYHDSVNAFALDLGALYPTTYKFFIFNDITLGTKFSNFLASDIKWDTGTKDNLEKEWTIGASALTPLLWGKPLLIAADVTFLLNGERDWALNLGAEYPLQDFLFLRAGFTKDYPTLGVGLALENFQFDYALGLNKDLDYLHYFSGRYFLPIEKAAEPTSDTLVVPLTPTPSIVPTPSPQEESAATKSEEIIFQFIENDTQVKLLKKDSEFILEVSPPNINSLKSSTAIFVGESTYTSTLAQTNNHFSCEVPWKKGKFKLLKIYFKDKDDKIILIKKALSQ